MSNVGLGRLLLAITYIAIVFIYYIRLLDEGWWWRLIIFYEQAFRQIAMIINGKLQLILGEFATNIIFDNLLHYTFVSLICG